jgi:hypothetical protein
MGLDWPERGKFGQALLSLWIADDQRNYKLTYFFSFHILYSKSSQR